MLVRFVRKSRLVELINNLDLNAPEEQKGKRTHRQNCESIIDEIKNNKESQPSYISHPHYELYLTYLHLAYLYLQNKLNYKEAESDLAGFFQHMRSLPQNEIPYLDQDDFLQAYQLYTATNDYSGRYHFVTPTSATKDELNQYIDQLCQHYPALSRAMVEEHIKSLKGINNIFIALDYTQKRDKLIMHVVKPAYDPDIKTPAFFATSKGNKTPDLIIIPPIKLVKWIIQETGLNKKIEMEPIFGKISVNTLNKLHRNYKHPISLHSKFIKYNLRSVHSVEDCTGLSISLHDKLFHCLALALYPENAFLFVLNVLIPEVEKLRPALSENELNALNRMKVYLNDFSSDSSTKNISLSSLERQVSYTCDMITSDELKDSHVVHLFLEVSARLLENKKQIQTKYQLDMDAYIRQVLSITTATDLNKHIEALKAISAKAALYIFNVLHFLRHHQLLDDTILKLLLTHAEHATFIYEAIKILSMANSVLFTNKDVIKDIITHTTDEKLSILIKELMYLRIGLPEHFYKLVILHIDQAFTTSDIIQLNRQYNDMLAYPALAEFSLCHTNQVEKVFGALIETDTIPTYLPILSSNSGILLIKKYAKLSYQDLNALLDYGNKHYFDYTTILTALQRLFAISPALVKPHIINRILSISSQNKIEQMVKTCQDLAAARPKRSNDLFVDAEDTALLINKTIKALCENSTLSANTFEKLQKTGVIKLLDSQPELLQSLKRETSECKKASPSKR